MNGIGNRLTGWIARPICREPVFFCTMALLMSLSHVLSAVDGVVLQMSLMEWRNVAIALSVSVFMAWGMAALLSVWQSRTLRVLLYAIGFLLLLTDLFLYYNFGTLLSPWILLLLKETNGSEASEFLGRYLLTAGSMKCYGCLLLIGIAAYLLEKRKVYFSPSAGWTSAIALAFLPVLALGGYLFLQAGRLVTLRTQYDFEAWHGGHGTYAKQSTPINLLHSWLYLRISGQDNEKAIRASQEAALVPASCLEQDTLNVVLVIGESFSKRHTPLYGYYLDTTPRLCALRDSGNLFVFQDVVAPYNMTTFSVKNILSTNSLADGEPWYARPSFPVVFKKAGFHVSIWDNQRPADMNVNVYDYALGSYMYAPQMLPISYCERNSRTYDYDLDLAEACREHRQTQKDKGHDYRHSLYIFHLMGQHSDAALRFPPSRELQVFGPKDIRRDDLDEQARQIIADYDNATRYNDLVVASIADIFRDKPSVMVYLSDHGEEVFDYRPFVGRSHEHNKSREAMSCQYEIPFVLWCSNSYLATHPGQVNAIRQALDKPATADDVAHLLFSLASIQTPYYNGKRDLLSPDYAVGRRILQGYIDYDN